jgi:hypothetical protein
MRVGRNRDIWIKSGYQHVHWLATAHNPQTLPATRTPRDATLGV